MKTQAELKKELVMVLIREHIMNNKALVKLGCEEEKECYKDYLIQLKHQYMQYPLGHLEAMARSAQAKAA